MVEIILDYFMFWETSLGCGCDVSEVGYKGGIVFVLRLRYFYR